jgi:uncharacterized protein (UPF0248 family)
MRLRDFFNEHKWYLDDLSSLRLIVRHRGDPEDEREIPGGCVLEVEGQGLLVKAMQGRDALGAVMDGSVFIPFHRVLRVVGPEGTIWERNAAPAEVSGSARP